MPFVCVSAQGSHQPLVCYLRTFGRHSARPKCANSTPKADPRRLRWGASGLASEFWGTVTQRVKLVRLKVMTSSKVCAASGSRKSRGLCLTSLYAFFLCLVTNFVTAFTCGKQFCTFATIMTSLRSALFCAKMQIYSRPIFTFVTIKRYFYVRNFQRLIFVTIP